METVEATPPALLVPLHVAGILAAFPATAAFEVGEGYIFGFSKGFVLAFTGKAIGAIAAFGIARCAVGMMAVREWLHRKMNSWPTAKALASGAEKGGAGFVLLVRLSPIPCFVNNYGIALLTEMPWTVYVPASLIGLLPTTAANVYAGAIAPHAAGVSSAAIVGSATSTAGFQLLAAASSVGAASLLSVLAGYFLHTHYRLNNMAEEVQEGFETRETPHPDYKIKDDGEGQPCGY